MGHSLYDKGTEALGSAARKLYAAVSREFGSERLPNYNERMGFDDYKLVIYRNQPDGWVAEIPAIAGCHALMPTVAEAVSELDKVFHLIEEEYRAAGQSLPQDNTEIVHA